MGCKSIAGHKQPIYKAEPNTELSDNYRPLKPRNTSPAPKPIIEPHEQRGRRDNHAIRNAIQEALSKRPMTCHELALACDSNSVTIWKHVRWLEALRVVERFQVKDRTVWRICR